MSQNSAQSSDLNANPHPDINSDSSFCVQCQERPVAVRFSPQCLYKSCNTRTNPHVTNPDQLCQECHSVNGCRNCGMLLCQRCRETLRVSQCSFCTNFICSRACHQALLQKNAQPTDDEEMQGMVSQPPSLNGLLFVMCSSCHCQTCGCQDWQSFRCGDCMRYLCGTCQQHQLQRCSLEECVHQSCCSAFDWSKSCVFCNKAEHARRNALMLIGGKEIETDTEREEKEEQEARCGLVFCMKGHCHQHVVLDVKEKQVRQEEKEKEKEELVDGDVEMLDVE